MPGGGLPETGARGSWNHKSKFIEEIGLKSAYQKNNFLISQPKHMLWVLKRTVSMRRFF